MSTTTYSTTTTQDRTVDRRSLLTHFQQSVYDHQALFIFCLLNHFGIHSLVFTSTPDSIITPLHFPYSLAKNPHPQAFQSSSLNYRPTFPNQSSFPWPSFTPLSGKITPPRNPLACLLRHHCHSHVLVLCTGPSPPDHGISENKGRSFISLSLAPRIHIAIVMFKNHLVKELVTINWMRWTL